MSERLFVANFDRKASEADIKRLFSKYGAEEVKIFIDFGTGRSRGFGFVEVSSIGEGAQAIKKLNGKLWNGYRLRVCWAEGESRRWQ